MRDNERRTYLALVYYALSACTVSFRIPSKIRQALHLDCLLASRSRTLTVCALDGSLTVWETSFLTLQQLFRSRLLIKFQVWTIKMHNIAIYRHRSIRVTLLGGGSPPVAVKRAFWLSARRSYGECLPSVSTSTRP